MAGAVVFLHGRIGGIRGIPEIPVDADGLDLNPVVDAAVGADFEADLEALAGGLGRDLEVGEFVTVGIAELGGEIALAFHKAVAVGIRIVLLGTGGAAAVVIEPLDEMISEAGLETAGAFNEAPLHLGPDILGIALAVLVVDIDLGDDVLRLGAGVGGRARGDGLGPVGQPFRIVPPDRGAGGQSHAAEDEEQDDAQPARCSDSLVLHQLSSKNMTGVMIRLLVRRRSAPPARYFCAYFLYLQYQ
ncbi:MAG: hypothetical protein BWY77_01822 [bacterium ADurb.Bin431]|nr:MAG: hypothetical protein BWY77_01822 [bacterium ADurb.Bin431]